LQYNESTKEYVNAKNVDIDGSVDWGNVKGLEYLDPGLKKVEYYHDIINVLTSKHGYEVGKNLIGAPYDWRLAADGLSTMKTFSGDNSLPYYQKLKGLIEQTYAANSNQRVNIVTHSMGGPVALHFLHQQTKEWKDTYVSSFIPMSPPFGGSINTVRAMISGDNFDAPIVKESIFWPVQSTCASGPWLFPQTSLWGENEVIVQTKTKKIYQ
jgi:S-formylglutathione hydrolase FrmB